MNGADWFLHKETDCEKRIGFYMGFDKEKIKQIRGLLIFAAGLVLFIIYSGSVVKGIGMCLSILVPFAAGGCIAFVLNLPMRAIEKNLPGRRWGKNTGMLKRGISLLLAILFVVTVFVVVFVTVIPRLQESFMMIGTQIPAFTAKVLKELEELFAGNPEILSQIEKLQIEEINWMEIGKHISQFLTSGMGSVLSSAYTMASNIIGGVVDSFVAVIFAIYILAQKEKLADQGRRILKAYLSPHACDKVQYVLRLLASNFSHFIVGQCTEALILGCLFLVSMTVFRFPYALVISVLIAMTALIPIVGAFIGCAVGAFLILMTDPFQALWFVVLFLVLQQVEGNLIYPHVVGNSVGLPSIWVLVAVTVGGSLFGVPGMLFFIPLTATIYMLFRDRVNERIRQRKNMQKSTKNTKNIKN